MMTWCRAHEHLNDTSAVLRAVVRAGGIQLAVVELVNQAEAAGVHLDDRDVREWIHTLIDEVALAALDAARGVVHQALGTSGEHFDLKGYRQSSELGGSYWSGDKAEALLSLLETYITLEATTYRSRVVASVEDLFGPLKEACVGEE